MRDRRCLFELAAECIAARQSILQNPSFQLQLCALAARHGLLYLPPKDEEGASKAPRSNAATSTSIAVGKSQRHGDTGIERSALGADHGGSDSSDKHKAPKASHGHMGTLDVRT